LTFKRLMLLLLGFTALIAARAAADEGGVGIVPGESVAVNGTAIVCGALTIAGHGAVQCASWDARGPRPGSLAIAMTADGKVTLASVDSNRALKARYRRPQGAAAKRLRLGQGTFNVSGTKIYCVVFRQTVGPADARGQQVECALRDFDGILPRTYGTGISDRYAAIFRVDSRRERHPVVMKAQP
jgi:hypothetical protein